MATDMRATLAGLDLRRWWPALLFVALALLFRFVPQIDLAVASWFFDPVERFASPKRGFPGFMYYFGDGFGAVLIVVLSVGSVAALLLPRLRDQRRTWLMLYFALLLGPGLVVNGLLKQEFHRARPLQVEEFKGRRDFTPAFVVSDQCRTNCSFVSGHAAQAFYLLAFGLAFPRQRRRWMAAALAFGGLMGLSRMMAGAHFLSDIVFAFYAVYGSALLARWVVDRYLPPPRPDPA